MEQADVSQELLVDLLARLGSYDERRGPWRPFILLCFRHRAARFLGAIRREYLKRYPADLDAPAPDQPDVALTEQILDGSTDELRQVPTSALLQLIRLTALEFIYGSLRGGGLAIGNPGPEVDEEADAALAAQEQSTSGARGKRNLVGQDRSRSVAAFRIGAQARRDGADFEGMCEAIRTDPESAEWFADKGLANDRRELHRIWDKTDPFSGDLILSAASPLNSARQFIGRHHTLSGIGWSGAMPTLHHQNATFYTWRSSHYVETTPEVMRSALYGFLDGAETINEFRQIVPFNPTKNKVANVLEATASEAQVRDVRPPAWLMESAGPTPSELIACRNGLLHLPRRQLLAHTPAFFTLNALTFDFDPQAAVPSAWLTFLSSVWPDDPDAIATLQELFGLLLTADTSHQKAFLIVGPKRSGKGTIARALTELLGAANVCSRSWPVADGPFWRKPVQQADIGLPVAQPAGSRHRADERPVYR